MNYVILLVLLRVESAEKRKATETRNKKNVKNASKDQGKFEMCPTTMVGLKKRIRNFSKI